MNHSVKYLDALLDILLVFLSRNAISVASMMQKCVWFDYGMGVAPSFGVLRTQLYFFVPSQRRIQDY